MSSGTEHEERFRRVYAVNFEALLAYAMRRVEQPEDAADVVAETFLVAWRRSREMPPEAEARLWLHGVARRVLANHHRGGARRGWAIGCGNGSGRPSPSTRAARCPNDSASGLRWPDSTRWTVRC
ncbi:sigma factor [Micromonospora arborensis]|uniref:RNA polymerase sigma factor n=1 Tax=Micromonospora arborensis TaxID=2116518 RepID=UPI0034234920